MNSIYKGWQLCVPWFALCCCLIENSLLGPKKILLALKSTHLSSIPNIHVKNNNKVNERTTWVVCAYDTQHRGGWEKIFSGCQPSLVISTRPVRLVSKKPGLYMHTYVHICTHKCVPAHNEHLHMYVHIHTKKRKNRLLVQRNQLCFAVVSPTVSYLLVLSLASYFFFSLETFHLTSLRFLNPQDRYGNTYLTGGLKGWILCVRTPVYT